MSNFRVTGMCRCCGCEWNPTLQQWDGDIQTAMDKRTLPWMNSMPLECARCGDLLTTVVKGTPVAGTIPQTKNKRLPINFHMQF
ncbi:hypothetical protein KKE60_05155 [Patescibacteria group bacterium]|nr:hypothetical protein [Patescibacteria group bacterium]